MNFTEDIKIFNENEHGKLTENEDFTGLIWSHYVNAPMLSPQENDYEIYYQKNSSSNSIYYIPDYEYDDVNYNDCGPEEEDEDNPLNQTSGFVCEEVVMYKNIEQKYGLTLFYCQNSFNSNISDIFIGEIDPNSPASYVQEIQLGDQVLQVNHQDVYTRDQVMNLFAKSTTSIHLLLTRNAFPQLQSQNDMQPLNEHLYQTGIAQNTSDLYRTLENNFFMNDPDVDSDKDYRVETSSDYSSLDSSSHGISLLNPNKPIPNEEIMDLDLSIINHELNKLRTQFSFLEKIKAQKVAAESSLYSSIQSEYNVKPLPRMGTKLPIRVIQNQSISSRSKETSKPTKSDQILRFSNFSANSETPFQTKEKEPFPFTDNEQFPLQEQSAQFKTPTLLSDHKRNKNLEYFIKKNSSGSKYLFKKLTRNQFFKEKEKQFLEENSTVSTDDDAYSNINTDKDSPRAKRRLQFEKFREYKRQKEACRLNVQNQDNQKVNKIERHSIETMVMLTFL